MRAKGEVAPAAAGNGPGFESVNPEMNGHERAAFRADVPKRRLTPVVFRS